ncbi:carbohydrate kinase [Paracoccus suum]|uniref:Carbohydrate kinase n=1 Tax=Paracoccus suum TaxID=2259340 RepID=A0A344PMV5_9RHOB|nr:FGGY family carbohydrate kinase [Paracoccus suum]AXC50710.1 carbohydrate kinase [Paracoccus suum]
MAADLFLGIDIGTFETKGCVTDAQGNILAYAAHAHRMLVPQPGWAEHRPNEDWWADVVHVSRALLDQGIDPVRIAAVATSAIGPCMLPVDADGRPLMNAALYGVDTRSLAEIELLNAELGHDAIMALGGNPLSVQQVGPKILWLRRQRPEIFAKTARILTSTSYVVQRLTGQQVMDHFTAASFAPLYDLAARDWTQSLGDRIIAPEALPRLGWSSEIAGTITAAAAAETGLRAGTPVTIGTIDAAAEAISVGVTDPGQLMLMYGSSLFCIALTEGPLPQPGLWTAPWLFPGGGHASMAGLPTGGTLTHWMRDQIARELPRDDAFALLAAEAATSIPGANGLISLPYFSGTGAPLFDATARGALFGLNLTHTRADIARAVLEGIAMAVRLIIETWREAGVPVPVARAVGGGIKNRLWLEGVTDYGRITQQLSARTPGASYGDAFLAALAVGAVGPSDIAKWNPVEGEVAPNTQPIHDEQYRQFRALYEATKGIAAQL